MKRLNQQQLTLIEGGASFTAAFVTAFVRGINAIMDIGRSLGSAIRRINDNNICSL